MLGRNLPVLAPDPKELIKATRDKLTSESLKMVRANLKLKKALLTNPSRQAFLRKVVTAYEHNHGLLKSLLHCLSIEEAEIPANKTEPCGYTQFTSCLNYMHRDWETRKDLSEELRLILERIKMLSLHHKTDYKSALFLGAGMARFAHELVHQFETTSAIDLSLTMGLLYKKLLQNDLSCYRINLKNAKTNNEQLSFIKHSANQPGIAKPITPDYYIADATKLPLRDHSISVIYSIYFTDVIPLSSLWPEIKRILKPGGSFIHFGPLQYPFK